MSDNREWECDTCRAKGGTPLLCNHCLAVRELVMAAKELKDKQMDCGGWSNQGYLPSSVLVAMNRVVKAVSREATGSTGGEVDAELERDNIRLSKRVHELECLVEATDAFIKVFSKALSEQFSSMLEAVDGEKE